MRGQFWRHQSCAMNFFLISNPLAPLSMQNEDFRKLLGQRRVAQEPQKAPVKDTNTGLLEKQAKDKPRQYPNKALEEINAKYVDRAEIRRKGVEGLGEDHLEMKGLDFALLRAERERKASLVGAVGKGQSAEAQLTDRRVVSERRAGPPSAKATNNHGRRLAQAIEAALLEVTKEKSGNRRASLASTSYMYDVDGLNDIPVIRKKGSAVEAMDAAEAEADMAERRPLPKAVVDEICTIMRYCVGSSKSEAKGRVTSAAAAGDQQWAKVENELLGNSGGGGVHDDEENEESEDDIFGDAGTDYVATATKEADERVLKAKNPTTYFGTGIGLGSSDQDENEDENEDENKETKAATGAVGVAPDGDVMLRAMARRRQIQTEDYDYYGTYDDVASDVDEDSEEKAPAVVTKKARKIANKKEQARLDREMDSIQRIFDDKGLRHFSEKGGKPTHAAPKKKRRI